MNSYFFSTLTHTHPYVETQRAKFYLIASPKVIVADLNRTFPAHEQFKEGAAGQRSLFNVNKVC